MWSFRLSVLSRTAGSFLQSFSHLDSGAISTLLCTEVATSKWPKVPRDSTADGGHELLLQSHPCLIFAVICHLDSLYIHIYVYCVSSDLLKDQCLMRFVCPRCSFPLEFGIIFFVVYCRHSLSRVETLRRFQRPVLNKGCSSSSNTSFKSLQQLSCFAPVCTLMCSFCCFGRI